MGQITTGVRSILDSPHIYNLLQNLMGARRGQESFVQKHVKPFSSMRILDIGCGTAGILEALPEDVEYFGFDTNPRYIELAEKRYRGRGRFKCEMVETAHIDSLESFDLVLAKGVLHHLDDIQAETLVNLAHSALKTDGRFVALDCCYIPRQNPIAKFLIKNDRGQNQRTPEGYLDLVNKKFKEITQTIQHCRPVPYTLFIMECRK